MIKIKLICVGKLKEEFWANAQNEYIKRLQKFCKFEIVELPEKNQTSSIAQTLQKEGELILEKMEGKSILFDVNAKLFTSQNLADLIEKTSQTTSVISFIIGGSYGASESVKAHSNEMLSFGKITLPHNLARIVAIEQIYRAFNILTGTNYHK